MYMIDEIYAECMIDQGPHFNKALDCTPSQF